MVTRSRGAAHEMLNLFHHIFISYTAHIIYIEMLVSPVQPLCWKGGGGRGDGGSVWRCCVVCCLAYGVYIHFNNYFTLHVHRNRNTH